MSSLHLTVVGKSLRNELWELFTLLEATLISHHETWTAWVTTEWDLVRWHSLMFTSDSSFGKKGDSSQSSRGFGHSTFSKVGFVAGSVVGAAASIATLLKTPFFGIPITIAVRTVYLNIAAFGVVSSFVGSVRYFFTCISHIRGDRLLWQIITLFGLHFIILFEVKIE